MAIVLLLLSKCDYEYIRRHKDASATGWLRARHGQPRIVPWPNPLNSLTDMPSPVIDRTRYQRSRPRHGALIPDLLAPLEQIAADRPA